MNENDAIARLVFLAKEKKDLTSHRTAMEKVKKEAQHKMGEARIEMASAEKSIQKSINLLCDKEGEQKGLMQMLSPEGRKEAVRQIQESGFMIERHGVECSKAGEFRSQRNWGGSIPLDSTLERT